ncbi:MAG: hypothetical protein JXA99_05000 [Candidatus Lokiarchaeota archaeon]|nr:hypothetical protein [Candidatus Lokiarchaeota archaeon]
MNQRNLETSFKKIILDGLKLFKKTYFKIIPIFVLFSVIGIIFKVITLTEINYKLAILKESSSTNTPEFFLLYIGAIIIEFIIVNFFLILTLSILSLYLLKCYRKEESGLITSFKKVINKKLVLILLFLGLFLPITFLLVLPGLLIYKYYIFSIFTVNTPNAKKPFTQAKDISSGNFFRILIIFLINIIIIFSGNPISNLFFYDFYESLIISRNYGLLLIYFFVCNLLGILLSPLIACLLTSLFSNSFEIYKKEKKEQKPILNKDYQKR